MCRTKATAIGVRVVIELKRDATAEVVLNQLFRFTPMQTSFGCNMLALNGGRPEQLTLRDFLTPFHHLPRRSRRPPHRLSNCARRASAAISSAVWPWPCRMSMRSWRTIRASADPAEAREKLMTRRWPAHDIADYHPADRRSAAPDERGRHL